jgi:hypothetical protein
MYRILLLCTGWAICLNLTAQDTNPMVQSAETHYYDFWEGNWYREDSTGSPDTSKPCFKVIKGVHPACWKEEWNCLSATAIRSWDKTNNRWMYVWISSNSLFQLWEGKKVGNEWYTFKEFDINGDKYLSRQGVLPVGKDRITRISEKSYDNGRSWQLRFKEYYQRRK